MNGFTAPCTPGQHLDVMSAKLIMTIDLRDVHQVNVLTLSLSRVVDTVNTRVEYVFRHHISNSDFWDRIEQVTVTLDDGLPPAAKKLYDEMITLGTKMSPHTKQVHQDIIKEKDLSVAEAKRLYMDLIAEETVMDKKLDKKLLRVAIAKEKVDLLEADDTECLQMLDILDLVVKHCLTDPATIPDENDSSELACYRRCTKILDEVLNGTLLQILDAGPTCKASKSIAKIHEKVFGSSVPLNKRFGRRIDLILATQDEELSSSEWKRLKVSTRKSLVQQAKNIRMNKAVV